MFSRALEAQRQHLFADTVRGLSQRLPARGREPAAMFAALRWGMDALDRAYADTPARVRATVACRSGCGFCCSVPVDVQAHEVFFAAEHLREHASPEALTGVIARAGAHRARLAGLGADQRASWREPCALLRDGACSIYAGRPAACRAHHARDAAACAAHQSDPRVPIERAYVPTLRARMFAVMLGVDEALEAAGYDDRAYDFGAALHEALTDSLSLARWLRGEPAFPDSCLAEPAAASPGSVRGAGSLKRSLDAPPRPLG